jgi:hypothetical protein
VSSNGSRRSPEPAYIPTSRKNSAIDADPLGRLAGEHAHQQQDAADDQDGGCDCPLIGIRTQVTTRLAGIASVAPY